MKFTKRIMAAVACAVMSMTSIVGMSAFAMNDGVNINNANSSISTYASNSKKIISGISVKGQEKSNWCAAACGEAFTQRYLSTAYSQSDIISTINGNTENNSIDLSELKDFLNNKKGRNYFSIKSTDSSCADTEYISFATIKSMIDNNHPVIIRCEKYIHNPTIIGVNPLSHAVVCYGYEIDSSGNNYNLYIYDPDSSSTYAKNVTISTSLTDACMFTDYDTFNVYAAASILYYNGTE